jgi:hypothetical protein
MRDPTPAKAGKISLIKSLRLLIDMVGPTFLAGQMTIPTALAEGLFSSVGGHGQQKG